MFKIVNGRSWNKKTTRRVGEGQGKKLTVRMWRGSHSPLRRWRAPQRWAWSMTWLLAISLQTSGRKSSNREVGPFQSNYKRCVFTHGQRENSFDLLEVSSPLPQHWRPATPVDSWLWCMQCWRTRKQRWPKGWRWRSHVAGSWEAQRRVCGV